MHPSHIEEMTQLSWGTTYMGIAGTLPLVLIAGMGLMFKLGNRPE